MQYSRSILAFKPLIHLPPSGYFLSLHLHHRFMFLVVSLHLWLPLPPLTPSGFFNETLGVSKPGAQNFYTVFRLILLNLFVSRNLTLIPLPLSGFSALRSDCTHFRSGILSPDVTQASGVIIFVRQSLSFSELSTSSLCLLDSYSDYVGINISLNNSSLLLFLNVYAPPIRSSLMDSKTDFFSLFILLSSKNLFIVVDFNCYYLLWDSKGTSNPSGEVVFNWVISFKLLPFNNSDIPTLSVAPLAIVPPLPSSLLPLL